MFKLTITGEERWDDDKEEFIPAIKPVTLQLEHSLISLSKWEQIYNKPYLSTDLNYEETIEYIKCMTITQNVDDSVYSRITPEQIKEVANYIQSPMTATWFNGESATSPHRGGKMRGEIITAEVVYYWMITANIPVEFEKWHLNRLLTLIRVIGEKNKPPKKMSQSEITRRYAELNAQRKAKMHTKG